LQNLIYLHLTQKATALFYFFQSYVHFRDSENILSILIFIYTRNDPLTKYSERYPNVLPWCHPAIRTVIHNAYRLSRRD